MVQVQVPPLKESIYLFTKPPFSFLLGTQLDYIFQSPFHVTHGRGAEMSYTSSRPGLQKTSHSISHSLFPFQIDVSAKGDPEESPPAWAPA